MADQETELTAEVQRLRGRVAALEIICQIMLGQMLRGDTSARKIVADAIFRELDNISINTDARKGMSDTFTKFARDLMRDP